MFNSKEVSRILYISIIVLLETDMLVNTKAMESSYWMMSDGPDQMMSSSGGSRKSEDLKSLDVCTDRNQQRLGNVFGNFTRHHGKGHKRRITSTAAPLLVMTSTGTGYEHIERGPTRLSSTSPSPSPSPSPRGSLAHSGAGVAGVHIDRVLEPQTNEVRHRSRHRLREVMQLLEEESLSANVTRVKKMYRQSGAGPPGNRLVGKHTSGGRGAFLTDNCTTVVAQLGTTAVLHCEVSDITENTVTWIRKKDYSLLSVGLVTYSADNRFFSAHGRHVKDWALHIRFVSPLDAGYYECQLPTHPPTSIFFKLVLVAAYAEIAGSSEKLLHAGSRLRLLCLVRRATEPPSYVFWYFQDRMINYDLNGVSVTSGRHSSELVISSLRGRHQGNYTCVPSNARPASVTVHIVHSETPAAMQHGNSSGAERAQAPGRALSHLMLALAALRVMMMLCHTHTMLNLSLRSWSSKVVTVRL